MLEGFFQDFINQNLGPYISDVVKEDIRIALWSGEAEIQNVNLNPNLTSKLDIPFVIQSGRINNLKIKAPWRLGSSPVKLYIDGLNLVLNFAEIGKFGMSSDFFEYKLKSLQNFYDSLIKKLEEQFEAGSSTNVSYTQTIVDNIFVSIQ